MTQPLPSETIEYERYVDGLRQQNAALVKTMRKAWKAIAADLGMIRSPATISLLSEMDVLIAGARSVPHVPACKTITIHVEGGMVQEMPRENATLAALLKDILSRFQSCIAQGNGEIEGDKEAIAEAKAILARLKGEVS